MPHRPEQPVTIANAELLDRIVASFNQPRSTWRTAGGIGRELDVPPADVEAVIRSHPERFRRSSIAPAGIPLFGLRGRLAATRPTAGVA